MRQILRRRLPALLAVLTMLVTGLSGAAPSAAATPRMAVRKAVFTIGAATYTVNGQVYHMDASPVLAGGQALVPVRYLALAMGAGPGGIGYQSLAHLKKGMSAVNIERRRVKGPPVDVTVFFSATDPSLDLFAPRGLEGGLTQKFTTAPEVVPPGRLLVPCRDVAQALGGMTVWNAATRRVTVETWGTLPAAAPRLSADQVAMHVWSDTITAVYAGKPIGSRTYNFPMEIPNPYYPGQGQNPDLYALIPTLEAFGVPAQNILWDAHSQTLAVAADSPCRFIYLTAGANLNDNLTDGLAIDLNPPDTGPSVSLVKNGQLYADNTSLLILVYGFDLQLTDQNGNSIDPIIGNGNFEKT